MAKPKTVNYTKVNPSSPIFWLKIGDTEVTLSKSPAGADNFISFSMKLTAINVASDIQLILYDHTALLMEYEILKGYTEVQFKFGQDITNLSKLYTATITDYELSFVGESTMLTIKMILGGSGSTTENSSEESKSYDGTPSEVVKQLCKEEGWEVGKITDCEDSTKGSFNRTGQTATDFINSVLVPKAQSKDGKGNYTFYTTSDDKGKTVANFTPQENSDVSEYSVYEMIIGQDHEAVIEFTPNFKGLMYNLLGGGSTNSTDSSTTTEDTSNTGTSSDNSSSGGSSTGQYNAAGELISGSTSNNSQSKSKSKSNKTSSTSSRTASTSSISTASLTPGRSKVKDKDKDKDKDKNKDKDKDKDKTKDNTSSDTPNTNTNTTTTAPSFNVVVPSIDQMTNNVVGAYANNSALKRVVGSSSYNSEEMGKIAQYLFSQSVMLSNSAELEIRGDASYEVQSFVAVVVLTPDGYFHHSSGLYQVLEVSHDIQQGEFTTTLNMFRRGMTISEDGEITLLDVSSSKFNPVQLANGATAAAGGATSSSGSGNLQGDFVTSDEIRSIFDSRYKGLPYIFGSHGKYPKRGYDCSGFCSSMLNDLVEKHGGKLKSSFLFSTTSTFIDYTDVEVDWNNQSSWQPGDLLVAIGDQSHGINRHVVMVVDSSQICHAGSPLKYATIESQVNRFNGMTRHRCVRPLAKKDIYDKIPSGWENKVK